MDSRKCRVSPARLYLLVAPTASLVGSVQVSARVVETGMHKMYEVGFDIHTVLSGFGTCPLAPIAPDDLQAIGRTNDAVLYGGRAWYTVRGDDAQIENLIDKTSILGIKGLRHIFLRTFSTLSGRFL